MFILIIFISFDLSLLVLIYFLLSFIIFFHPHPPLYSLPYSLIFLNFAAMKTNIQQYIQDTFLQWKGFLPKKIEVIAQAGGNRQYFRLYWNENETCIATFNPHHIAENEAFIYFTQQFQALNLAIPKLLYISKNKDLYFQSDEGKEALFDVLQREKYSPTVYELYEKALQSLIHIQIKGDSNIDYSHCIASPHFDKTAIMYDLNYFFFYFLHALPITYHTANLFHDFETLADFLAAEKNQYFMFRDFQSRNILVKDNNVTFIDYQGGTKGAIQYDLVSILWQARAALPQAWKDSLLAFYFEQANQELGGKLDKTAFHEKYIGFILIRMLQTLGSYGFRGLYERRPYFLSAIPFAFKQLKDFLSHYQLPISLPELEKVLSQLTEEKIMRHFMTPTATEAHKLVIKIKSFSYKKGIPLDESPNGGGYVFDCRGILNPGRIEAYKDQTGRDEEVKTYLLTQTEMPAFLKHVYEIVTISVKNYLERDFDSLSVYFGCTGGQHRSVFAADSLAKYLKDTFNVKIELEHRERGWQKESY